MPTLNEAMLAVERHIGFPKSRARQVAQRLQEAAILPRGAPGIAPELEPHNVVSLIIALAADTTLWQAPSTVASYRALTPAGVDLTGAPASIDTAGGALDVIADVAIHGTTDLWRRDSLSVVSGWPEILIENATTGKATRFVQPGADASHWQSRGHRKSTTINISAFVDCLQDLFQKD
ncbi:hypothetical protein [Mesorhizobium sp. B2-4-8]|uniref:hypothetical protein n=1 Tax=Mesorhizobium sp. B2-4-8 TaxID=2589941 RepID=UPI0011298078|nr:hypothetical protein [Mesorhizobium sp. B2-4-8]TPL39232.1 hypothetical protein FJ947_00020 [Mesorhizobium sp. B2-4-8]